MASRRRIARYKTDEVRRKLKNTPRSMAKWIAVAFDQNGEIYKNMMHARFSGTLTEGRNAGATLATRTGKLAGSIGAEVTGKGHLSTLKLHYFIGNSDTIRYAVTQEEGKVIVGRPWLAIPLPAALTGTGRSRIERPSLVKNDPAFFLFKSKAGNLIIAKRTSGGFEPWWVLKRSVKIRARLGFVRLVNSTKLRKDLIARVRGGIVRGMREA